MKTGSHYLYFEEAQAYLKKQFKGDKLKKALNKLEYLNEVALDNATAGTRPVWGKGELKAIIANEE